jgi:hypothetical protein
MVKAIEEKTIAKKELPAKIRAEAHAAWATNEPAAICDYRSAGRESRPAHGYRCCPPRIWAHIGAARNTETNVAMARRRRMGKL